jgi:hypothetical protein
MTGRAGKNARRHGVGRAFGRLRTRGAAGKCDQREKNDNPSTATRHRHHPIAN